MTLSYKTETYAGFFSFMHSYLVIFCWYSWTRIQEMLLTDYNIITWQEMVEFLVDIWEMEGLYD